jgi:imidazolonepropionase-like amidohydrolase
MHAHPLLTQDSFFPGFVLALYVANGVTGIRDMFGPLEQKKQWRKAIDERMVVGPRMILAGPLLDGPKSHIQGAVLIKNEDEARQAIRSMKAHGADFAKIHETLSRDSYFALADEAKRQNLPFDGHVPASVTAFEASDAGQRSIEHLTNVAIACSSVRESLQSQWSAALLADDKAIGLRDLARAEAQGLLNLDEQNCRELAARFVKNRTWQDPTLVVLRVAAFGNSRAMAEDPRLRYIPVSIRKDWAVDKSALFRAFTREDFVLAQKAFPTFLKIVGLMHRAGVKFLAGSDPPAPYCLPGFSIHDELSLFVDAGLSPADALRTATINPAKFLGTLGDTGTVEVGKTADLVLLDANPLEDISNTRKISGVVLRGDYLPRRILEQMLAKVASAVNRD